MCMTVGPVCVCRDVGDRDGDCGQLEQVGWVMNLLLRLSVKHNHTYQNQEVPFSPTDF